MYKLKLSLSIIVMSICYTPSTKGFQKPELANTEIATYDQLQDEGLGKGVLLIPNRLGDISVHHSDNGFIVKNSQGSYPVQQCYMDKKLRGITKRNLAKLIAADAYLSVNKMDGSNEYSLKLNNRLRGGGLFGASAGFYIGQLTVNFLGHGTLLAISALTGPAAPATLIALEASFGPFITAAAVTAGLGTGMIGAVVTGPV